MVEILLATHNGAKYLREQLESVFSQTMQDFKVIARDDGSIDDTLKILEEYHIKYPEKFIYYKNNVTTGNAKDNFFMLMQDSTADFVCFCDQDDVWHPDKLELTYSVMKTLDHSKPALVHTDLKIVDSKLKVLNPSFFKMQHFNIVEKVPLNRIIAQNVVTGCTMMINRALLDVAKNTNHKNIIMHDWWLAIIAAAFGNIGVVNYPTMAYRQHGNNSVGAKSFWKSFRIFNKNSKNGLQSDPTYIQAGAFVIAFKKHLPRKIILPIEEFSRIKQYKCKLTRIKIILKNKFLKQSLIRQVAQLIRI